VRRRLILTNAAPQCCSSPWLFRLGRREREILEVLYQKGEASSQEVRESLGSPPSYSAIRATLRILERKGAVRHKQQGLRYVFFPSVRREDARRTLLPDLLHTYFDDSISELFATSLEIFSLELTGKELSELSDLIETARKRKGASPRESAVS
jgi:BlaI family transcriptional regulator, penicillinase repressor